MQLADDVEDLLDQNGREAHGGLVEHQQLRAAHKRSAHREHLLLAAGERSGDLPAALFQARKARVDVRNAGTHGGARLGVCAELKVFLNGHLEEDVSALRDLRETTGDDLVRRDGVEVLPLEAHAAAARVEQTGNGVQHGGFARAVRADERHDLAGVDVEGHALHGVDAAVENIQVCDLQHFAHACASFFLPR